MDVKRESQIVKRVLEWVIADEKQQAERSERELAELQKALNACAERVRRDHGARLKRLQGMQEKLGQ